MTEEREHERRTVDYAAPALSARYSVVAVAAWVCFLAAACSMVVLLIFRRGVWIDDVQAPLEVVAYLGPFPAFLLGFRGMVIFEKKENEHLRGRWMAAWGLYGSIAMLGAFCWRSMQ